MNLEVNVPLPGRLKAGHGEHFEAVPQHGRYTCRWSDHSSQRGDNARSSAGPTLTPIKLGRSVL